MLVFFFVLLIILTLFSLSLPISVTMYFDMLKNDGVIKVRLFLFTIFVGKISFQQTDITHNNIIIDHKGKKEEIHLSNDKKDKHSIVALASGFPIFNAIAVRDIALRCDLGKSDDALLTTMLTGAVKIVMYSALAFIKSYYNPKISEQFNAVYDKDVLNINAIGIISTSFANITISAIKYLVKLSKKKEMRAITEE